MIIKIVDEMYVTVFVEDPINWGKKGEARLEAMRRDTKILLGEIKRHVDYYDINTDYDSHWECSFCGCAMVAEDDYECCDKSVAEHEAKNDTNTL